MRVLVTGGAGFIGSHIVDALVDRGDEVVVLDDLSTGKRENLKAAGDAARLVVGDVGQYEIVREAMTGCELVFHEAAIASVQRSVEAPRLTEAVNLRGTLNVLEAARACRVRRVVFAGSAAVYGDDVELPARERVAPMPLSPYAVEKLASEHYVRVWSTLFELETVGLRYFNVFGPRQDPKSPYSGVISIFVDRLLEGQVPTIFGDGEQTRDFVYVGDVVRANLLAAEVPAAVGGVFNIARGEQTTLNALYGGLAELTDGRSQANHEAPRPGDIRDSLADIDRARSILGFTPQFTVGDGLKLLVAHERAQRGGPENA